ncbi:MAG: APH(3') family aminoglycoside O-phosphotransferase [Phototrophicaceae bacterium]
MQHLPLTIRAIVDTAQLIPITVGMSGDDVYRVEADAYYYLKIGESLTDEYERLLWLDGKLPIPKVIHYEVSHGKHYLLTSAIAGEMLQEVDLPIEKRIALVAQAARMWHAIPIVDCPFLWDTNTQIADARHQLDHKRVDASQFAACWYGKSEHELFADLLNAMPNTKEDFVLIHGDLCLPNILVDSQTQSITGFVDLGNVSVSDRHLELTTSAWSIGYNWGSKYIPQFYEQYGSEHHAEKSHFYSILGEFV